MPFHPSLRSLLLAHRFHRLSEPSVAEMKAQTRAAAQERLARHEPEYEDRSGGYMGSESHVTGRNLDGPMG